MIEQDINASTSRSLILTISTDANRMNSKFHLLSSYWQTVPPQLRGGRLFDGSTGFFFTKTAVTPERKVEKSFPRWEMNGHSEGYKWVIDQNWGHMAKIGFLDPKPKFWVQKKAITF